ncbi:hypothetical protein RND81_11G004300 [Saponaria officinalis]|uniref:Uncharacterized protein n=1 Tax=Saponaria officinalis TaxID=3572 RepID=A0AAW1HGQ4_SAPOF
MEYANSTKNKIELIQIAIQQLIESNQTNLHNNDQHQQILTNLISQLEALKADGIIDPPEPESKESPSSSSNASESKKEDEKDESKEVIKELKKLEKQNRVTHWLLSTLILVTVAWQLSEVSLLLKLRQGITNPFKSFGNMFKDVFKRRRHNEEEPLLVPRFELPELVTSDEKE